MKNGLFNSLKYLLLGGFVITTSFSNAQKLPNIQTGSLQTPSSVKIDGQATEWGNKFQAYNHSSDVFYTVANNDKFFYVIIQATDADIIKKIIRGSITVSINTKEKETLPGCKAIEFPLIKIQDEARLTHILGEIKETGNLTTKSKHETDSLVKAYNAVLQSISKELKISTRYGIPDSTLSIYNDKQLAVNGQLDNNIALTYEFKIPFAALNIPYSKSTKIYYNVKLNGTYSMPLTKSPGSRPMFATTVSNVSMSLFMPTDFWAEYKLY